MSEPISYNSKQLTIKHPFLKMSRARAQAWAQAEDEAFYQFIDELAHIYGKKHYKGNGIVNSTQLFGDFKRWKESFKIKKEK